MTAGCTLHPGCSVQGRRMSPGGEAAEQAVAVDVTCVRKRGRAASMAAAIPASTETGGRSECRCSFRQASPNATTVT